MVLTSHTIQQLCPVAFHAAALAMLAATQAQSRRVISRVAKALEDPENFRLFAVYKDGAVVGGMCYELSKSYVCAAGHVSLVAAQSLLAELHKELGAEFCGLRGCDGPPMAVEAIAAACEEVFGCWSHTQDRLETMILDEAPKMATGVQGVLKPVAPRSKILPILALWFEQFEKDTDNECYSLQGNRQVMSHLSDAASCQDLFIWEVKEKPVAMAILGRTQPKQLLCVYTPPHHRGRGFGQAVTAATCAERWRIAQGKELITLSAVHKFGAARVYERVGFRSAGWLHGVSFETRQEDTGATFAGPSMDIDVGEKAPAVDTDVDTDVGTSEGTDVEAFDELDGDTEVEVDLVPDLEDIEGWDLDLETDPAKLFASSACDASLGLRALLSSG